MHKVETNKGSIKQLGYHTCKSLISNLGEDKGYLFKGSAKEIKLCVVIS